MFIKGKTYIRREIHNNYGGQQQSGISTPANKPLIFLFSGDQGEQYGYRDGWTEDGIYLYSGQGQRGNMEFLHGNKAIRDHIENGKDLHLFEYVEQGKVRYVDQLVYTGFLNHEAPDLDGNLRTAIVFELVPLDSFNSILNEVQHEIENDSMDELRRRALEESKTPRPPRESSSIAHYRSEAVKTYVLRRASGVCEACNSEAPFINESGRPYLEPHHIRRVSDGGPDHPEWVIGVCPNCHKRAHHSIDKVEFNSSLREIVLEKERLLQ